MKESLEVERILVIRLSAIGDIFMSTVLLPALHERYPRAEIHWLTDPVGGTILAGHPGVDQVMVWPRRQCELLLAGLHFIKLYREIKQFVTTLRREHYDMVLDIQGLLKSGVWSLLARAEYRLGLRSKEGSQFIHDKCLYPPKSYDALIGSEYRALARHLGDREANRNLWLYFSSEAEKEFEEFLHNNELPSHGYICLCPFTTRPQKHWFQDRWAMLATKLFHERGWPVVIVGGPSDGLEARNIMGRCPEGVPVFTTAGEKRSLQFALALLSHSRGVIGVDTGLTHAGIGLGRPTVALFGSTRPYLDTGQRESVVLYENLPCSPCFRHPTCEGRFECMQAHTVEKVYEQLVSRVT